MLLPSLLVDACGIVPAWGTIIPLLSCILDCTPSCGSSDVVFGSPAVWQPKHFGPVQNVPIHLLPRSLGFDESGNSDPVRLSDGFAMYIPAHISMVATMHRFNPIRVLAPIVECSCQVWCLNTDTMVQSFDYTRATARPAAVCEQGVLRRGSRGQLARALPPKQRGGPPYTPILTGCARCRFAGL